MGDTPEYQARPAAQQTQSAAPGGPSGIVGSAFRALGQGFEQAMGMLRPPAGQIPKAGQPVVPDPVDRMHLRTLAQLLKTVNPLTAPTYGPLLDAWAGGLTQPGSTAALLQTLASILKTVNPATAAACGPLLDAWASLPLGPGVSLADRFEQLVAIVKLINPPTAPAYGPLLDAWHAAWKAAKKAPAPR